MKSDHGELGVLASPEKAPDWWVGDKPGVIHVFGNEIENWGT